MFNRGCGELRVRNVPDQEYSGVYSYSLILDHRLEAERVYFKTC